jgi:hypothetical protein
MVEPQFGADCGGDVKIKKTNVCNAKALPLQARWHSYAFYTSRICRKVLR